MDRGAWQAMVHRVAKSQTQLKQCSTQLANLLFSYHPITFTFHVARFSYDFSSMQFLVKKNKIKYKASFSLDNFF